MSDLEDHYNAAPVQGEEIDQAAAAPSLPLELNVHEFPAGTLDVPLDPRLRHPLRNKRRGSSLAIRHRVLAFGLPEGALLSYLQGFVQILIRRSTATTEDGHRSRPLIRLFSNTEDHHRSRPRIPPARDLSCCFVSHLFGCAAFLPFGLVALYLSSMYPGSGKSRGRGLRFRGSGSAHADPLVPRQRSDYTKGDER